MHKGKINDRLAYAERPLAQDQSPHTHSAAIWPFYSSQLSPFALGLSAFFPPSPARILDIFGSDQIPDPEAPAYPSIESPLNPSKIPQEAVNKNQITENMAPATTPTQTCLGV